MVEVPGERNQSVTLRNIDQDEDAREEAPLRLDSAG